MPAHPKNYFKRAFSNM